MPATGSDALESVTLVLTASCNLSCRYCYQNAKSARRMSWTTLAAGLELVVRSEARSVRVAFVGGEPLLEAALVRRAVEHLERRVPADKRVSFSVITNGVLVSGRTRDFLIDRDIDLRLSMDGIPAAQDLRKPGTFETLDRMLIGLRRDHPEYFRRRLSAGITLVPDTVKYLADSVRYFLDRRVASIGVYPVSTHEPGWEPRRIRELDEQFAAVYRLCLDHRRRTGTTPLDLFSRSRQKTGDGGRGGVPMCGITAGRSVVVDVDGTGLGCTLFTDVSQRGRPGFLRRRLRALDMGRVDEPGFAGRFLEFSRRVRESDLFGDRRTKRSTYGRCKECRYLDDCRVCPVSIGHVPGNDDPHRVPDFPCAFYRSALAWRERFPARPGMEEIVSGGSAGPHDLCERAARRGAAAIRSRSAS